MNSMHRSTDHVGKPLTTVLMSSSVDVILVYVSARSSFIEMSVIAYAAARTCVWRGCGRHTSPCPLFPCGKSEHIPYMLDFYYK